MVLDNFTKPRSISTYPKSNPDATPAQNMLTATVCLCAEGRYAGGLPAHAFAATACCQSQGTLLNASLRIATLHPTKALTVQKTCA